MKLRSIIFLITLVAVTTLAQDKPKSDAKKAKSKAKASAEETGTATASGFETIGSMIPEGMKNLKVRIPGFEEGRNTSLVVAKSMTRVTAQELFAEEVTIHLYKEQPKDNVQVDMRTGTYHMDTKLLTSKQRSRVSRADFKLEGDTMVFDTATSQGKMTGRVHMIIYDSSSMAPKRPEQPATKPEAPSTAAPINPATSAVVAEPKIK